MAKSIDQPAKLPSPLSQTSRPTMGKEEERSHRVRVKNRRKRYLDQNPDYFNSSLELADPLLYDRLIRRFQTAAEREDEGRRKGFSGVLHADLIRSEAKLDALMNPSSNAMFSYKRG